MNNVTSLNAKLVVLIDNDFVIRDVLKKLIKNRFNNDLNILTSENGVEGVGYIFISKPDVIILDTTLPKYGGLELIEYLQSNQGLRSRNTPVILIHQSKNVPLTNYVNTIKLNKDDKDFLNKLIVAIDFAINVKNNNSLSILARLMRYFGINAIKQSNRSTNLIDLIRDLKQPKIKIPVFSDIVFSLEWLLNQILLSLNLTFFTILSGRRSSEESNIQQGNKDLIKFRTRYYPTIAGVIASLLIIIVQVAFFVLGGIVIFGTRIDPSSALTGSEENVNLTNATYDSNEIEFIDGAFRLKEIVVNSNEILNQPEEEIQIPEEILESLPDNIVEELTNPLSSPQVQGVQAQELDMTSDESTLTNELITSYSINNPEILFNNPIQYSVLKNIFEESNVNNRESSLFNVLRQVNDSLDSDITYQLSPNKVDWYYFEYSNLDSVENNLNLEGRLGNWVKTTVGYTSSNSIRELNYFLDNWVEEVGKSTKELYIKAFLHSNGVSQTSLNNLIVERDVYLTTSLESVSNDSNLDIPSYPQSVEINEDELVNNINENGVSTVLPSPTIYQATFFNGNKIVIGKILNTNISDSDFGKYKVRVYYTTSTDISTKALDKTEFIGETSIYLSSNGDISFYLETPNREGGYVTSELVYVNNGIEITSTLSNPLENSTFTVDSTADDDDDILGNGVCLTAGGECTLRAALSETSELVGTYLINGHNIYFNIPTSDAGYRDYDDANTLSSGDSTGGDDYWTIRPTTQYTILANSVVLDGSTQESLSGFNRNTSGPDIEIKDGASVSVGIYAFSGVTTTGYNEDLTTDERITIRGLNINSFTQQISIAGSYGLLLEDSYLCTDPKGEAGIAASGTGISMDGESNTIRNNVIGNCSSNGITGDLEYTKIQGNKIGVNALGNTAISVTSSISATTSVQKGTIIGGSNPGEGNILRASGTCTNIRFGSTTGNGFIAQLVNNTCGLNLAKDTKLASGRLVMTTLGGGNTITVSGNISGAGFELNGTFGSVTNNIAGTNESKTSNLGDTSLNGFKIVQASVISDFSNNSAYYMLNGVYNLSENVVLDDLDLQNNANAGVLLEKPALTTAAFSDTITVKNSVISNNTNYGIAVFGLSPTIKGNEINNNGKDGIVVNNSALALNRLTSNVANSRSKPVIGGQNAYSGSLCNGLEQNCIEGNDNHGIQSVDNIPSNEATLYADNDFGSGNGVDNNFNIVQSWVGGFEIFSGTNRRTDVTTNTLTINLPSSSFVRTNYATSTKLNSLSLTNANTACVTAGDCPATGHTDGTNGQSHFMNGRYGYIVNEYVIDNSGDKTDYSTFKIEDNHFASNLYSFDGDSTSEPVSTGSNRTINTFTYADRGEPWVDNPTYARNVASGEWGRFQIMEVEYVDANPVLQGDGTYTITVDSTEDLGNGTVTYFNDGAGNGSGGIVKTVTDGLSNGKTSFREALLVSTTVTIDNRINVYFNIPTTDTGYRDYDDADTSSSGDGVDGDDYWTIRPATNLGGIVSTLANKRIFIDATTQTTNQGDRNTNGPEIEIKKVAGTATNGILAVKANNLFSDSEYAHTIKGLAINGFSVQIGGISSKGSNILNTYLCTDVKGLPTTDDFDNAYEGIYMAEMYNINIKDNLIGNCSGGLGTAYFKNSTISGNYMGVSKDGNSAMDMVGPIVISNFEEGSIIGGDNEADRNYLRGDYSCLTVATGSNASLSSEIKNNYCGLSKDGTTKLTTGNFEVLAGVSEGVKEVSQNYATTAMILTAVDIFDNVVGTDVSKTLNLGDSLVDGISLSGYTQKFNDNYVSNMKYGVISSSQSNLTEFDNNSLINNVIGFRLNLTVTSSQKDILISSNLFEDNGIGLDINTDSVNDYEISLNDNMFRDNTTSSVKILGNSSVKAQSNVFETTNTTKAVIDISGGTENSNLVNTNDALDSDSGVNNLMNSPEITSVEYIGGGTYTITGSLDNTVSGEGPFDIEVCVSDGNTNGGGCLSSVLIENITQNTSGLTNWSDDLTIVGATGNENRYFSALATNNLGATSEFSSNFYTENNPNYTIQSYDISLTYPIDGVSIDDTTPLFDWNASLDPDLASYQLFINGSFVSSIPKESSQYQYVGDPLSDNVTWKIVGIRNNGSIGGESITQNFKVLVNNSIGLSLVSPIGGIRIDDTTPYFDWNASNETSVEQYRIYLNNEILSDVLKTDGTSYQSQSDLPLGNYTWKVSALNSNGEVLEETEEENFEIFEEYILSLRIEYTEIENILTVNSNSLKDLLTQLSLNWDISGSSVKQDYSFKLEFEDVDTGDIVLTVDNIESDKRSYLLTEEDRNLLSKDKNYLINISLTNEDNEIISEDSLNFIFNIFKEVNFVESVKNTIERGLELPENISEIVLPLLPLVGAILLASIASIYVSGGSFFSKLGLLLIGSLVQPKRKRWGIVYDQAEGKPLPFAQVRISKRK